MLPAAHRMRRSADFARAVRRGRRAGSTLLVAHLLLEMASTDQMPTHAPARVGFVVSKAVGSAVIRNRVKRRLRPLVAARLGLLPDGSLLVVRALPASSTASSAELADALDRALRRLLPGPDPRVVTA